MTRIIRPRPGGRASAAPAAAVEPVSTESAAPLPDIPSPYPPGSLLPAAMPLLQLLGRLRTLAAETDPTTLRDRTEVALRSFDAQAQAAGIASDLVRRAHYALCDSLDAAALNTPWGPGSAWARRTMVATFHPGIGPGRFADALHQAETRPELAPVLELMLTCLSLGVPDESMRARAAAALGGMAAQPPPADLSPRWKGIDAPVRPRAKPRLPVWVAGAAALALAAGLFVWLRAGVDAEGDALFAAMLAAPPAQMPVIARDPAPPLPPPPPAATPTLQDRLRARLADPALADPTFTVAGVPAAPILRLPDQALFAGNGATLLPAGVALVQRVAAALKPEAGTVRVIGYADDRPVRTVAFASSFKLSAARAEAVRAALVRALPQTSIAAEGRGAADPVAPNATEAGRAQNRRIDILFEAAPPMSGQ